MVRRGAWLAALTLPLAVLSAGSAQADTPGCVSKREFARVSNGMLVEEVHRIFDTSGRVTGLGAPNELRHYRPCARGGVVQVTYSPRGRVVAKSGQWFD